MHGRLTLRNYRCFDWNNPAVLEFGDGFTAYVGSNNSGKSAALRSVYELRRMFDFFNILVGGNQYQSNVEASGVSDHIELANEGDPTRIQFDLKIFPEKPPETQRTLKATDIRLEYNVQSRRLIPRGLKAIDINGDTLIYDDEKIRTAHQVTRQPDGLALITYRDGYTVDFSEILSFAIDLQNSKYFPAFRNAINEGAGTYYDIPVGTSLVTTWDQWKAGKLRVQKVAISQVEKEIASLLGFETLQINADQTNKTLDVIIDSRPQKLYEVGAGVAQLIIVLAAALVHKPPYILIDEPELSLHPALQLNFLATLGSYASKGLLYATHSIGLARSTAQRIYGVKKIRVGVSQMHPFGDNAVHFGEWLGELDYSTRIDLGCEGLLLVEGATEVLLFQEFLRKLGKDHKYVVIQLGGSSLIRSGSAPQLAELTRIIDPARIRVFIDSEKASADEALNNDRAMFVSECREIGIRVDVSIRRATENYFESNGIYKVFKESAQPLGPYQKLSESPKPWRKSDNWRIARETEFQDIKDTDLGVFLESL